MGTDPFDSDGLRPGLLLKERYRILTPLDAGAMGSVWLGEDETLHRPIAVKVPHAQALRTPSFRERFEREVRRLVHLEHPHITRILDAGQHDGTPYAVLAYVAGGNLADRLRTKGAGVPPRLPASDLRTWLPDAARALDFIHANGVIHRDVKPANILLDPAGNLYVTDFGLAKAIVGEHSLTPTDTMIGSPAYLPPEAMSGGAATPAFDQYGLATVVFEMVSGVLPFPGGTAAAVLMLKAHGEAPSLALVAPDLPPALVDAVDRALRREPSERHRSCCEFASLATG